MVSSGGGAVLGVDGYPGGWVGAVVASDGLVGWRTAAVGSFPRLAEGLAAAVIGVDMPIGLPVSGWREADVRARQLLGAGRSRVFMTPPRAVVELAARTGMRDPRVQVLSRRLTGQGVSLQALGLAARIVDVDQAVSDDGRLGTTGPVVVEVHPELSFAVMPTGIPAGPAAAPPPAGAAPEGPAEGPAEGLAGLVAAALPSKRTARGVAERLVRLRRWLGPAGVDLDVVLAAAPADVPVDDALDALAGAWSARRWADGTSGSVPAGTPPRDPRGLPMRIVV